MQEELYDFLKSLSTNKALTRNHHIITDFRCQTKANPKPILQRGENEIGNTDEYE